MDHALIQLDLLLEDLSSHLHSHASAGPVLDILQEFGFARWFLRMIDHLSIAMWAQQSTEGFPMTVHSDIKMHPVHCSQVAPLALPSHAHSHGHHTAGSISES